MPTHTTVGVFQLTITSANVLTHPHGKIGQSEPIYVGNLNTALTSHNVHRFVRRPTEQNLWTNGVNFVRRRQSLIYLRKYVRQTRSDDRFACTRGTLNKCKRRTKCSRNCLCLDLVGSWKDRHIHCLPLIHTG